MSPKHEGSLRSAEVPGQHVPAVGVADGFPYPLGGGGVAKAKRPIDRGCHTRGDRKQYLPYILPSVPWIALYSILKFFSLAIRAVLIFQVLHSIRATDNHSVAFGLIANDPLVLLGFMSCKICQGKKLEHRVYTFAYAILSHLVRGSPELASMRVPLNPCSPRVDGQSYLVGFYRHPSIAGVGLEAG